MEVALVTSEPNRSHESPWKTFLCATSAFVAFTIATAVILFYFRKSPEYTDENFAVSPITVPYEKQRKYIGLYVVQ
ncbi:hypothetical protein MRX96_022384 [Rhipicephalus microplus]